MIVPAKELRNEANWLLLKRVEHEKGMNCCVAVCPQNVIKWCVFSPFEMGI